MTKTCKIVSKKYKVGKKRKTVERRIEQWREPEVSVEEELAILEDCSIKFGLILVFLLFLLAVYCLSYNVIRERQEGPSRACAKLCQPYLNFDLRDVIAASYTERTYPNYWSIPHPGRDDLLREKACRTPSQLARDRKLRIMGTSQSTDAENAVVDKIVGSETKYSLLDLSAWKGSSVATLLLFIVVVCGLLLVAVKKYRNLRKLATTNMTDMESGRRRGDTEMIDMVKLGNYLRSPPGYNTRSVDVCCPQDTAGAKACSNKLHLALEAESRRKLDMTGKE